MPAAINADMQAEAMTAAMQAEAMPAAMPADEVCTQPMLMGL